MNEQDEKTLGKALGRAVEAQPVRETRFEQSRLASELAHPAPVAEELAGPHRQQPGRGTVDPVETLSKRFDKRLLRRVLRRIAVTADGE